MSARRDGLAVAAVVIYAGTRGRSFLPDQIDMDRAPAGVAFLSTAFHVPVPVVLTVYAGAWMLVAVLALLALLPGRRAAWLLWTAALSIASAGFYTLSWVQTVASGADDRARAWATGAWYLGVGLLLTAYVLQATRPTVVVRPATKADA